MNKILVLTKKYYWLLSIVTAGIFLRFYHIKEFLTFLGDQGRDAIVLKKIIMLQHLPAIGAPSSVGQVYLGPFYYYFIAPWLALFNFDPLGPAVGVAFFSCIYLIVNYFIVRELVNSRTAFFSTLLITFSAVIVNASRYSWNPNLLPFFTLLFYYFLIKSIETNKPLFFVATGIMLALSIQLHYLALFLIPGSMIYIYLKRKVKNPHWLKSLVVFAILSSPLVLFDLRHQFLNVRNLLGIFQSGKNVSGNIITNSLDSFVALTNFSFNAELPWYLALGILIICIYGLVRIFKKPDPIRKIVFFLVVSLLGISFYAGPKNQHYLGIIYPLFYIVVGYLLSKLSQKYLAIAVVLSLIFIGINLSGMRFLYEKGPNLVNKAIKVAEVINANSHKNKFALTSLPEKSSESPYRYFLEIWGKPPLERETMTRAEELFVTCEEKCLTIGNPQWDIAYFAANKVEKTWRIENVTIYKLIH